MDCELLYDLNVEVTIDIDAVCPVVDKLTTNVTFSRCPLPNDKVRLKELIEKLEVVMDSQLITLAQYVSIGMHKRFTRQNVKVREKLLGSIIGLITRMDLNEVEQMSVEIINDRTKLKLTLLRVKDGGNPPVIELTF